MQQFGYFRLEHKAINRASKGDGFLSAHVNYAANSNKCERVIAVNMPTNRYAIQRVMAEHEASLTRKNARLGDTMIVSLPVELSEAHRYQAARRFLWALTLEGRGRAVAFYHTDHVHNPHLHVVFLDRDIETGLPVAMMGASRANRIKAGLEPNPTVWARKLWADRCNSVLTENGYGIVIDYRSNLERGLDEPGKHRGFDNDNIDSEKEADTLAATSEDADMADDPIAALEREFDAASADLAAARLNGDSEGELGARQRLREITGQDFPDFDADEEYISDAEGIPEDPYATFDDTAIEDLTGEERVKRAIVLHRRSHYFSHLLKRRDELLEQYTAKKQQAEKARTDAAQDEGKARNWSYLVGDAKAEYDRTHRDGKAKGITIGFFGYTLYRSRGVKDAEHAAQELSRREYAYEYARKDAEMSASTAARLTADEEALLKAAQELTERIETEGGDEEVVEARDLNHRSAHRHVKGLSTEEIQVMIDEGEITPEDAIEVLQMLGRSDEAEALAEGEGITIN